LIARGFIFSAMPDQMDKTTLAFFALVLVLFAGQVFINEQFVDVSGSSITLSLTDLLALIGTTPPKSPAVTTSDLSGNTVSKTNKDTDLLIYKQMRTSLLSDVKKTVRDELLNGSLYSGVNSSATVLTDDCIDSFSAEQGANFMRYIPGKNPADYVRKDSVPCYGCSVP
jgi:hypothetical protein